MAQRFYINCPLSIGPVELTGAEAHHLAAASRLRPGDAICLFNGDGHEYSAQVAATGRRHVTLEVTGIARVDRELARFLEVAAPLPKGERARFLVEKLTELGVSSFVPLRCQRSVVEPGESKLEKLERYVIEASKQCGRNVLMAIAEPADWASYCCSGEMQETRIMAHPVQGAGASLLAQRNVARCAVGPEGGFTNDEVGVAENAGWQVISLGPRILRVETAALVLAARLS